MSKIAANPGTFGRGVIRRGEPVGATAKLLDVAMNPIADGCDSEKPRLQFAKFMLRESHELIRFAISARIKVRHNLGRQFAPRRFWHVSRRPETMLTLFLDRRKVFLNLQLRCRNELLAQDTLEQIVCYADVHDERTRAGQGVAELATDAKFKNSHVLAGPAVKSTRRSAADSSLMLIGVAMVKKILPST